MYQSGPGPGVKQVVVLAGANHRKYMRDLLEKMPDVTERNINEMK